MKPIFSTKYGKRKVKVYEVSSHYLITSVWWFIPFFIIISKKALHAHFHLIYAIVPTTIENKVMEELVVHELVHARQFWCYGCIFYLIFYRFSFKFRFKMEMEAFIEQIAFMVNNDSAIFLDLINNPESIIYMNLYDLFVTHDEYGLATYVTKKLLHDTCYDIGYNFYHNHMS